MDLQSWVAAVATAVLALFAAVQIGRERRADKRRRRAVEAQVSGTAFLLRRQLRSWLGIEPHRERGMWDWLEQARQNDSFGAELDKAESRMEELARLAPEVGGRISAQVSGAYVLFLAATNRLNIHDSTPRPQGGGIFDWAQLINDAIKDTGECLAALEDGPISKDLLDTHAELQERRERDAPLAQIADKLFEEMKADQVRERDGVEKLPPEEGDEDQKPP